MKQNFYIIILLFAFPSHPDNNLEKYRSDVTGVLSFGDTLDLNKLAQLTNIENLRSGALIIKIKFNCKRKNVRII